MADGPFSNRPRAGQQQSRGPLITELGDPNFSPSEGSQRQVPGAAAQSRVFDNMRSAQSLLDQAVLAGHDVEDPRFQPLHEQAQTGFKEEALSIMGELVGWIDGPAQAVNLFVQDLLGGEAEEGFRNPNFGDYWGAFWGGADAQTLEQTGLDPQNRSMTLDMLGWAEEEDFMGRVARGVADFGYSVLTDPLTYVTFGLSALGKKVALSSGRALQDQTITKLVTLAKEAPKDKRFATALDEALQTGTGNLTAYERELGSNLEGIVGEWQDDLLKWQADKGGMPADVQEALSKYLGNDDGMFVDNLVDTALANRIHKDVIQPLVDRNFRGINAAAKESLPKYAHGGARISVPFTRRTLTKGVVIPGTVGLGRQLVGDPLRALSAGLRAHAPGYSYLANAIRDTGVKFDQAAPLLRALARTPEEGGIEGWQYRIAQTALDNMNNSAAKHTISTELNARWNSIAALADASNTPLDRVGADILLRLEGDNIDETMVDQLKLMSGLDSEDTIGLSQIKQNEPLSKEVENLVTYMQETMNSYHTAMSMLDPEFREKFIKGYIPHTTTKEGRTILTALAGKSRAKTGQGDAAEDLYGHLLNAAGQGGRAEPNMGATRHVGRSVGRVQALSLIDDGVLMLDEDALKLLDAQRIVQAPIDDGVVNPNALETRYIPTPQLNEILAPILRREAELYGIPVPKNWDGKIFNENPIDTMIQYIENMTDAIHSWSLINALKASGLAMSHATELDMQQVVSRIMGNLVREVSDTPTTHFGTPTVGETDRAPTSWLNSIAWPDDLTKARAELAGREIPDYDPKPAGHYDGFEDDIAENGVQTPILVEIWEDGSLQIVNGHHRLAAMENGDLDDAPVQFVKGDPDFQPEAGNGINVSQRLKPDWQETISSNPRAPSEAHEIFDTLPWGATTPNRDMAGNILEGPKPKSPIKGVTLAVYNELNDSGFKITNIGDIEDARELARELTSSHPQQWADDAVGDPLVQTGAPDARAWRWKESPVPQEGVTRRVFQQDPKQKRPGSRYAGPDERPKMKEGEILASADVRVATDTTGTKLTLAIHPYADAAQKVQARQVIMNYLDRAFKEGGDLEGMLNKRGLDELIEAGMDSQTAEFVHTYMRRRLGSLSRSSREFLSREPGEFFQTRMLFDDWKRGLNELIVEVAAMRSTKGGLIADPNNIQLMADPAMVEKYRRLQRAAQSLGSKGYDEAVAAMADTEVYAGVQKFAGFVNPDHYNLAGPAIDGLTIQNDIAEWLSLTARNMGTIYTPEGIAAAKMATRETLKWWRAMATLPRPAFHIRNLIGGSWMNMNFGVTSKTMAQVSTNGIKFRNALANAKGTDGISKAFEVLPPNMRKAWREAWENNVMAGFSTTEFSNALTPRQMHERWGWAKAWDVDNFVLTRAGGKVMESVEDFLRMSLFMQYYDESVEGSAKMAASIVEAVHFNYSNLTPTETKLKSLIPFFVWTRRNLPLQIQSLVENPRTIQKYMHMMRSMNENMGGDDPANLQEGDHFSAYAAGTDYRVNSNTPFWSRVMIDPDLPVKDLLDLPNPDLGGLVEFANNVLGPHVTTLFDVNAQREFGDVNAPAPFNAILQGLAAVGFYDRTEDGDVRIPYMARSFLETFVPFTRDVVAPLAGGPNDPGRQQRWGIKEDDDAITSILKSAAGTLAGGFGVKMTTPADTRAATYRSEAEIDDLIKELRLKGIFPAIEEQE